MPQRSLVIIKPDAVARGLVGAILARYEAKGLRIVALDQRTVDTQLAREHYAEHVDKPFYPELERFITSGPLVAMVLEGERAIDAIRILNGATNSAEAAPGSIRGDFSLSNSYNCVHASDSEESAEREIALWFTGL